MPNESTDVIPSETGSESETPTNEESETVEPVEPHPEGETETTENQADYYEQELKRLSELEVENERLHKEAAEKNRQIEIKNRALQVEKEKRKPAPSDDWADREERLLQRLETRQQLRDAEVRIKSLTRHPAEQQLILKHYNASIVKTGDVERDVQRALAVANEGRIHDLLKQTFEDDRGDATSISSMTGGTRSTSDLRKPKSAIRKEIEKMIPKGAEKHLSKYVPR